MGRIEVSARSPATLAVLVVAGWLLWAPPLAAAPVPVRFAEGVTHGFLLLRTVGGVLIATGDLLQVSRDIDDVPAFVRFEGPLATMGPTWRIELASPRWP
jgi:hypothetical protein